MKYKTKIISQGNGYIGHAILEEEIVYTSNLHKDTIMVVRELSKYIAENSKREETTKTFARLSSAKGSSFSPPDSNHVPQRRQVEIINSEEQPTEPVVANSSWTEQPSPSLPPPRKCCGRG